MAQPKEPNPDDFFPPSHRKGLFYSDAWLRAWQNHWGDHPGLTPLTDGSSEQPQFYRFKSYKKGILPVTTAIPAGATSRAAPSIRAEYFCIADDPSNPEPAVKSYLEQALEHRWDQLNLPDVLLGSQEYHTIVHQATALGLSVIEVDPEPSYAINIQSMSFEDYLRTLGPKTRRALYNRRKRLAEAGRISLENIWPDRERFYKLINGFHQNRWGKPCYKGRNLAFIDQLLLEQAEVGSSVQMSVLSLSGKPISVVLDVIAGNRCYNLQPGYLENAVKGVSLGSLHLGYRIEQAFEQKLDYYDFMAGRGKHTDYKPSLATHQGLFANLTLVRSNRLKLAYRMQQSFIKANRT